MSAVQNQGGGTVERLTPEPETSVAVWDLAPDDGGAPAPFQAIESRAAEMIAAEPQRYRLVVDGEAAPLERSDRKPIVEPISDQ